jgi:hypothetical protein
MYSGAWFDTTSTTPSSTVLRELVALFHGLSVPLGGNSNLIATDPFTLGASGVLKVWQGPAPIVHLGDYTATIPAVASVVQLPSQVSIAVGYRTPTTGPRQRGRSRFFLGGLGLRFTPVYGPGGARIPSAVVDQLTTAMHDRIAALAALGWTLVVNGAGGFAPATEVYIDDVFDVQRGRRTWSTHQSRLTL